jgi:hypothetical protein
MGFFICLFVLVLGFEPAPKQTGALPLEPASCLYLHIL